VAVRVTLASASTVLSAGVLRKKDASVVLAEIVAVAVAPAPPPPSTVKSVALELVRVTVRSEVGAGVAVMVAVRLLSPSLMPLPPLTAMESAGTVKLAVLDAVPPAVVTEIGPVVTPVGAVAVIEVALSTVYEAGATPLKLTAVAPVKSVPVMFTIVPARPEEGLIPVIVGGVPPPPPPEAIAISQIAIFPDVFVVKNQRIKRLDEEGVSENADPAVAMDIAPEPVIVLKGVQDVPFTDSWIVNVPLKGAEAEVFALRMYETVPGAELNDTCNHCPVASKRKEGLRGVV